MPRAKNRWERVVQILRWLQSEFEFPGPVKLEIVDRLGEDDLGEAQEVDGAFVIRLSASMCKTVNEAVETALHEAAHICLWKKGLGYEHGPTFWKQYGKMHDAFSHHGHSDSRSFPVD